MQKLLLNAVLIGVMAMGASAEEALETAQRIPTLPLRESSGIRYTGREFNPAISAILDFTYAYATEGIEEPTGFEIGGHGHGHGHGHGLEEGLRMREVELTFQASVDPYFDAMVMLTFSGDHAEVEEAYIVTRALPAGWQIKAGKFLSDVGYINKQHPHSWLFVDAPWMREFMFGDAGLNEKGAQLSWLPPADHYLRLGVEVFEGETEGIASYAGGGNHEMVTMLNNRGVPDRNRWQADNGLRDKNGPRLFTGFAKWGPDIGFDHALQLGTFGGYSRLTQHLQAHSTGRLETWEGDGWFAGADVVYKYNGQGVMGHRNFVLQAEYLYRQLDLDYRSQQFESFSSLITTDANTQRWQQDGLYIQGVYGFAPRWNAGLRLDVMGLTNEGFEGRGTPEAFGTSYRYTGQISYAPTEFSRIRFQTSYMDVAEEDHDDDHHNAWLFVLQYNVSIGAHGAHAF